MGNLEQVLSRVLIKLPIELGGAGTLIDGDGRLICTMNLRDLTLTEAFAFASLFIAGINHSDLLIDAENEANPTGFTPELEAACRERCADFGDPPCWQLPALVQPCEHITPCDECMAGAGPANNREGQPHG